ncbi:GNAT family N-acetyltransferase [Microbacterium halotolerans]|uniref:GNAT family N-acetyltransferase n=1 Tax=Microbacterium halotolerans TaxID=246613 RepID=UPI000E6AACB0|nr:GNAT family N-acetyltransferase [Microbacterium halotolerans]
MTPRLATVEDLPVSADTLAAAFEHYPWTRHVIPDEKYHQRLHNLQLLYLEYAHTHGIVAVAGNSDGVIALLPPDAPEPAPEMIDQIVRLHGDRIDRLDHADSPAGAWRLETLGVHPNRQGRGIASVLLTFALSEAARRGGEAVALDTSDPRNVRLYERHGFQTNTHTDAGEGPPVWKMSATLIKH